LVRQRRTERDGTYTDAGSATISVGIGGSVAHAVSASYLRSEHMPPQGMALAFLLHALVAFFLWWMSYNLPPIPTTEDVVELSFEAPKPPEPPPPAPTPTPTPTPTRPIEGIRPPAEITSDKPTQVRPTSENPTNQNIPLPPQQSLEKAIPTPEPEPPPPSSAAFEPPKPAPTPPKETALEKAFEKATPPLPKPAPPDPKPQQQALAIPPANPNPRPTPPPPQPRPALPQIAPSPLSRIPQQQRPSAVARGREAPQTSSFVNPADTYNKARAGDNYLWEIVRKLQGYQYHANVQVSESVTVLSVTIARDGRLLNVVVMQSSGFPEMDRGVVAGVRQGSPYTPLPDSIQGASATFRLPLISTLARQ
jgi:TonB family protein